MAVPLIENPGSQVSFSTNVSFLEPSATLALAARARRLRAEGRSIVDLSAGEPAYDTPSYAAEAGIQAIREGRTGYPPTQGIPELREAIAAYLGDTTAHGRVGADAVLVGAGVKQALFNVLYCLFGPGDEVLVPVPTWPTYLPLVRLSGADPVEVETRWEDAYQLDPDALEAARTPRTRGLLLNSPGNPTGAVYPAETLGRILAWADEHGIWVISDEIYRRLHFGEGAAAPSVFDVPGEPERVVLLDGVSKCFAMTGWRIGFAAGPRELIRKATDLQSQTTSGAAGPSQYAAAAAYGCEAEREAAIRSMRTKLAGLRELGMGRLRALPGLEVLPSEGAIYFFVRLAEGRNSPEAAEGLLLEQGVACIPGDAFRAPGCLRFNFAVERQTLEEGLARIESYFGG